MPERSQNIQFHFLTTISTLKNRTELKLFINDLIKAEGFKVDTLNYIFCSDEYLLKYNKQYLKHNTLTDIITFQLNSSKEPLLADIYISVDRTRDNALKFNSSFIKELHRVIFHGALHLCGFKDKLKSDKLLMRQKEDFYLQKYFVSRETF